MKRLIVTGGAGFIGSNFIHFFIQKYPNLELVNLDKLTYAGNLDNLKTIEDKTNYTFVKGDICDKKLVEDLLKKGDSIVNFAAETHVDRSIIDAGTFVTTDVYGTYVLLEASRKIGIDRFIQISTDEVYGEAGEEPSTEEDPLMPKSPYAASKAGADRLAYSYYTTYGLDVVITRCSNNFGPYQYPEKLIPLFVTNAIDNISLPVYGTGKNTRDWIYAKDHCLAIDKILNADDLAGEVFNIGSGVEKSILDITEIILRVLNKPDDLISFVPDRLGHVFRHAVNPAKLKEKLGWKTEEEFDQSIEETIHWYQNNEDWWRKLKQ